MTGGRLLPPAQCVSVYLLVPNRLAKKLCNGAGSGAAFFGALDLAFAVAFLRAGARFALFDFAFAFRFFAMLSSP